MKLRFLYISLIIATASSAQNYEVIKSDFNSNKDEYAAGYTKGKVIFSSNKKPKVVVTYFDNDDNYYSNLYFSEEEDGVAKPNSQSYATELATDLNEGSLSFSPDGKTMWYTSNIREEHDKIRPGKEFKLGIFKAQKEEGKWKRTGQFKFNSTNQDFNTAHPTISPDGSFMIFASDRTGGIGASDLWISHFKEEEWQTPELLPTSVNSIGTELFPFIDENNVLYYSSNGHKEANDLDIFSIPISELETGTPVAMPEPINSNFDDFGLIKKPDFDEGYFSSDREEDIDNVFSFRLNSPVFTDCNEHYEPTLCYIIEETDITEIDTLPFKYIWDLGDGSKHEGFVAEHCYAKPGTYNISLSVIDSITGISFAQVNDMELVIEHPNQPYISSQDTMVIGEDFVFSTKETVMDWHEVDDWYWDMGDGTLLQGEEVTHKFESVGVFYVSVGAMSVPEQNGKQHKICTYKEILVLGDQEEYDELKAQKKAEELANEEAERLSEEEALALTNSEKEEQARGDTETIHDQEADGTVQQEANDLGEQEIEDLSIQESLELESLKNEKAENEENTNSVEEQSTEEETNTDSSEEELPEEESHADSSEEQTSEEESHADSSDEQTSEEESHADSSDEQTSEEESQADSSEEQTPEEESHTDSSVEEHSEQETDQDSSITEGEEPIGEEVVENELSAGENSNEPQNNRTISKDNLETRNGVPVINYDHLLDKSLNPDSLKGILTEELIESVYFVELLENDLPVSLDDEYFEGIRHEITERFLEEDSLFVYSVGEAGDIFALWDIYQEVLDSGYISAIVKQERLKYFTEDTKEIKPGDVIEEGITSNENYENASSDEAEEIETTPEAENEEWNRTISTFANVQFEYNSSRVTRESENSLDYIALVMEIEEDFNITIDAHTDNVGSTNFNKSLSVRRANAVKRYLIRKGVNPSRLKVNGYGEEKPISDNDTEQGRAMNRRVEFKLGTSFF